MIAGVESMTAPIESLRTAAMIALASVALLRPINGASVAAFAVVKATRLPLASEV